MIKKKSMAMGILLAALFTLAQLVVWYSQVSFISKVSASLSILGLFCVLSAGLVLLPKIFVPDEELNFLDELPIEPSTSHMTSEAGENLSVVVADVAKLDKYRKSYIGARKEEKRKEKIGLGLFVLGFIFQAFGVALSLYLA